MMCDRWIDQMGTVVGVVDDILFAAAVSEFVEVAEEVTGPVKHLQGMWDEMVVVGNQGGPCWAVPS